MQNLKERTKIFAIEVIRIIHSLPPHYLNTIVRRQLIRSATSVGANYRSALRGRSKAEFVAKIAVALEEADESCYWLELLFEIEENSKDEIQRLMEEANELTAILVACSKTAKLKK